MDRVETNIREFSCVGFKKMCFCMLWVEDLLRTLTPNFLRSGCKARGSYLRVHFKNTRNVAHRIRQMKLKEAQKFLQDVIEHKRAVPFTRYNGGPGRHAQAKAWGVRDVNVGK